MFQFYCVNDFHGSIVEQMNGRYYEAGISRSFGELKRKKAADPEHTILLSTGDMFQGSMESNSNFGKLIVEGMNNAGFDAMAVGNHDFDYGQDHLLDIVNWADFPVLGGNVRNYPNESELWNPAIAPSTIIERGNKKIGIIGMIGEGQTTSITSKFVQDITFPDPKPIALAEAKRLRQQEKCDLVVYLLHNTADSCMDYVGNKELFDGVFTGHSHHKETYITGGVPIVQSYCNGENYSHFEITFDAGSSSSYCSLYESVPFKSSMREDEEISDIRDQYLLDPEFENKASAVAGFVTGTLAAKEGVSNISCKAIYEKYAPLHSDLSLAIVNGQRAALTGEIKYRDIYKATPFLNSIVIAKVKGEDILREAEQNCIYSPLTTTYESNKYYTVACIDFLLYHQGINKQFNYFTSLNEGGGGEIIADYETYPFDLVFDYIHDDLGGAVRASDFSSSKPGFHL